MQGMKKIVYKYTKGEFVCDSCAQLKAASDLKLIDFHSLSRPPYPGIRLPENELKGLSSAGFWDAREKQNWGLGKHRNEGLEIAWLENGNLDFNYKTMKKSSAPLGPNALTITRPWQEHSLGNPNIPRSRLHWIILDFGVRAPNRNWLKPDWIVLSKRDFAELSKRVKESDECVFTADKSSREAFRNLCREILKGEGACFSRVAILVNQILLSALEVLRTQSKGNNEYFSSNEYCVKLFLEQLKDMSEKNWTISAMAEECGLKETRFTFYCKHITNMTPLEYLSDIRLQRAYDILREAKNVKIIDAALSAGFSSSQYFATAFKRKFGMAPSEMK